MLDGKKIVVVMPAYNAEKTLPQTYAEIPHDIVDEVIVVDDASSDKTVEYCRTLDIIHFTHKKNLGYGANQKTCYREALKRGADVVIMLHPDYQYTPMLIPSMAWLIISGLYDIVLGSRILGTGALEGGMPFYKYIANRFLTFVENIFLKHKLAEYHTGYRAFSRKVLETLPLEANSDDFVFDNQFLAQAIYFDFRIAEITCPTKYFPEASSINLKRSITYGFGVLKTALQFRLAKWRILNPPLFKTGGKNRLTLS